MDHASRRFCSIQTNRVILSFSPCRQRSRSSPGPFCRLQAQGPLADTSSYRLFQNLSGKTLSDGRTGWLGHWSGGGGNTHPDLSGALEPVFFAMDQIEIADIDNGTSGLTHNKNDIPPQNGVNQ